MFLFADDYNSIKLNIKNTGDDYTVLNTNVLPIKIGNVLRSRF